MSVAANKILNELKLENEELKHLLLKLTSKYKTSETKRNVLLKRNAMLITDNKNLHIQLLEATKKRTLSERAVKIYQDAVNLLKTELRMLKNEALSGGDQTDIKSGEKSVACSNIFTEKRLQQKEESEPYFEVSDESVRDGQECSKIKSSDSKARSVAGTCTSDDLLTEAEALSPSSDSQKDGYVVCSEINAYFQVADKNIQIDRGSDDGSITKKQDPFEQKRDRLWAQIRELREMTKVTDEELEIRRSAVAAKAEMIQDVHEEIKRMKTLISLAK